MTVEHRQYQNGSTYAKATACPLCGDDIGQQESLAKHLRFHCEEKA